MALHLKPTFQDYSPVLKNLSYALSTAMPGSQKKEDQSSQSSNQQKESICYRVGIDPLELVNWLENLRMWISQTILVRLVNKIDDCNKQLKKLGMCVQFCSPAQYVQETPCTSGFLSFQV